MLRTVRVVVPLAVVLFVAGCAEPPDKEMNQAQGAIDAARAAGADHYAASELSNSVEALRRSHDAVAQNDYRLALSLAIDSREQAQVAAKTAVENRAKARGDAERVVAEANSAVKLARTRLTDEAIAKLARRSADQIREQLTTAENTVQEARAALRRDDYVHATTAADTATAQIKRTLAEFEKLAAPPAPRKRR